jgi:NhaP-type Na+/H+ or K+/H+ antiporter
MICVILTATFVYFVLDPDHVLDFTSCLILVSIIAATDPIAVVALLKEVGADKKLNTLIEGESLLNDGTAMVAFLIFLKIAEGEEATAIGVTT